MDKLPISDEDAAVFLEAEARALRLDPAAAGRINLLLGLIVIIALLIALLMALRGQLAAAWPALLPLPLALLLPGPLAARFSRGLLDAAVEHSMANDHSLGWIYEHQEPGLPPSALADLRCGPIVLLCSREPDQIVMEKLGRVLELCHDTFRRRNLYQAWPMRQLWMLVPGEASTAGRRRLGSQSAWFYLPREAREASKAITLPRIADTNRMVAILLVLMLVVLLAVIFDALRQGISSTILLPLSLTIVLVAIQSSLARRLQLISNQAWHLALARRLRSSDPADPNALHVRGVY